MPPSPTINAASLTTALSGRYAVHAQSGQGGQGVVFRATRSRDLEGNEAADDVALKLYEHATEVERITREVGAMEQVRHPALANLIEHGTLTLGTHTLHYVACDFIEGHSLAHRFAQPKRVPNRVIAAIGRDVATAIARIWDERIVHRDVNPKNIMLRVGERDAVLIDLGIARHTAQDTLTSFGVAWGTVGYMSPEQSRAEHQLNCLSDVFSLGVVLLEALAGAHPTGGDQRLLSGTGLTTASVAAKAPASLAALIDQMLELRPAFRPEPDRLAEAFADLALTL